MSAGNVSRLAWLVVIKGVEWFVQNTPADLHILRLFIRPEELSEMCTANGMKPLEILGSEPVISGAFFKMLATGVVPKDFRFKFTRSTRIAYTGYAERERPAVK